MCIHGTSQLKRRILQTIKEKKRLETKMELNRMHSHLCFLLIVFSSVPLLVESFNEEAVVEDVKRSNFPDGFFFGTSTSSYQIEGAYLQDGKSLSNWDVFTHTPGAEIDGANGDVANNHYNYYLEDIETMNSLGVNAYRFSISWARVLPRGRFGEVNPRGVLFYNDIMDNLLLRGIEPFVTINHSDFPQELEERYGSWLSPLMQEDFLHFAETCFESFGDRVKYWITINEPNLFLASAYKEGTFPPCHCSEPYGNCSVGNSIKEPLISMHNMLLAHAKAAKLYREHFQPKQRGSIGITGSAFMYEPFTDDDLDREAASRALAFDIAWIFDPLLFGDYPPEMRRYHGNELPSFSTEERNFVKGSIDFIGINHYSTLYAKDCIRSVCDFQGNGHVIGFSSVIGERNGIPIGEPTAMAGFYVVPRGMEEIIDYLKERYPNKPIFVLENGYAELRQDIQEQDSLVDVKRVEFHKAYLASLARAIRNGANVRGYFIWTLMDDFEWLHGYNLGFGLYYIDRKTLQRMPKLSAKWYTDFLTNSTSLDDEEVMSRRSSLIRSRKVKFSGLKIKQAEM
ncbi:beta-glucosidase 18-like [Rhododendron vialii]|uniref:beta-glucosidase 18-like n=1 Tax=Rhododendron vialii TaxID=182163 RepID=UPI00265F5C45|nr:beta-glucosidase 18-like [Rhododendron vialii]